MTAKVSLGPYVEKRMTQGNVNRHMKEPELKSPGDRSSSDLGGGNVFHGPICTRMVEKARLGSCGGWSWTQLSCLGAAYSGTVKGA